MCPACRIFYILTGVIFLLLLCIFCDFFGFSSCKHCMLPFVVWLALDETTHGLISILADCEAAQLRLRIFAMQCALVARACVCVCSGQARVFGSVACGCFSVSL